MSPSRRGFTLVEMLVVLGIIAVLVALLMPAVMAAVNSARRAAIGVEIKSLADAVEAYKLKHGDYPPNFREYPVFIRHVRKCYPKIDPVHLNLAIQVAWNDTSLNTTNPPAVGTTPAIDEGESLVLWLYLTDNDPRYPFKWALAANDTMAKVLIAATSPEKHFPFEEDRLVTDDGDRFPSYRAAYSKDTNYTYIDSRSYTYFVDSANPARVAYAEFTARTVRPYWSENVANAATGALKPMNPTTFQIICAGQDGEFGADLNPGAKRFPTGGRTNAVYVPIVGAGYMDGDRDNMTNFTEGRRLEDHIP